MASNHKLKLFLSNKGKRSSDTFQLLCCRMVWLAKAAQFSWGTKKESKPIETATKLPILRASLVEAASGQSAQSTATEPTLSMSRSLVT